jgi:hypothetical protein
MSQIAKFFYGFPISEPAKLEERRFSAALSVAHLRGFRPEAHASFSRTFFLAKVFLGKSGFRASRIRLITPLLTPISWYNPNSSQGT